MTVAGYGIECGLLWAIRKIGEPDKTYTFAGYVRIPQDHPGMIMADGDGEPIYPDLPLADEPSFSSPHLEDIRSDPGKWYWIGWDHRHEKDYVWGCGSVPAPGQLVWTYSAVYQEVVAVCQALSARPPGKAGGKPV